MFAFVDQLRADLDPAASVVEEVAGRGEHVLVEGRPQRIESFLDRLLFPGPRKHTAIAKLSGGELNRVLLAKLLIQGGNVLVLDEPTNDLDLDTLRTLEEALLAFPGSALVVSHDRYFLDRVATRVLYLDGQGGARHFAGAASELLERLAEERAAAARSAADQRPADRRPGSPRQATPLAPPRLAPWERRELEALTARLEEAEARLSALDARLADPALYRGPRAAQEAVRTERESLAAQLAALYARWESLEERA